jgi:alpha-methylacyl-CoA racemase
MLAGIKIVEFEGLGPAPFASMMLADLGAEVTVVHRARKISGAAPGSLLDRGKRSIALNLKDLSDLTIAQALIAQSDGLIEGYRPGVMERLGLGPEPSHVANPKLVYGRMTGWGQTGPRSSQAGHDLNYIATSGALHYASLPDDIPVTPATLTGDIGGGALYLVAGMLAGLLNAARTGEGTTVDAAIVDGSAHTMALLMALGQAGGLSETRGHSLLDGPHWSRCYTCAGGGHISVQCLEPQFYAEFLNILQISGDHDFAAQHDKSLYPKAIAKLTALFIQHPRKHWGDLFANSDACVAPVLSPQEAAQDPHMQSRAIWTMAYGALQPGAAPRFDGRRAEIASAPQPDADRASILAELRQR